MSDGDNFCFGEEFVDVEDRGPHVGRVAEALQLRGRQHRVAVAPLVEHHRSESKTPKSTCQLFQISARENCVSSENFDASGRPTFVV